MSEEDYLRESGVGAIRASDSLQSLIDRSKADSDFRNAPAGIDSVLQDMPAGRAAFVQRQLDKTGGTLNEAARAMLAPYQDGRSEFQRELNRGIENDPAFAQAYAERFPITNAMMTLPSAIFENTGVGRILSAIGDGTRGVANFAGGLFPGAGATFEGIGEDLAAAPAGIKEDFTTMFRLKDDNPIKGEVRNVLEVKKNTSEDIIESSDVFDDLKEKENFMATEDRNPGIADANLLGGTPISEGYVTLPGTGLPLSKYIDPNTGRTISNVNPQFQNLNLGQFVNKFRDETGYFDQVIKQLGLGGR